MKFLTGALIILFISQSLLAQDGLNTGAHVSTSFNLNSHRNKQTTLWSSESGYGFTLGIPIRYGYAEDRAFCTGVAYEFSAYDNWFNNTLVSSMRLHYLHVPATIHFNLISSWFLSTGTGLNFVFRSRTFTPGNNVNISNSINPFQPYLSLGIGTCSERGTGIFELSAQLRYHFLDIWKKEYPLHEVTTSKVVSLDLVMRFYF